MINKEINIYKDLVEVNITDFNWKNEILYWEWTRDEFALKYRTLKAVSFKIHWWRVVTMNRIQWFDVAKWDSKTLQHKIWSLDELDQENIKLHVKKYKSDFKKYPTNEWINNLIEKIVFPEKQQEIEFKKQIESQNIVKLKLKRINYFNKLNYQWQKEIEDEAWKSVFKINANYSKHDIKARILFNKYKNQILNDLIDT